MKTRKFVETICVKISKQQRTAIEALAESEGMSIGGATREILSAGIEARGLA